MNARIQPVPFEVSMRILREGRAAKPVSVPDDDGEFHYSLTDRGRETLLNHRFGEERTDGTRTETGAA